VKSLKKYLLSMGLAAFMFFNCVYAFASDNLEIIHKDGLLTVSAEGAIPENIFMELGRECNISIIAHGKVFPQKEVIIKLKDMPIRDAVKRLVRVCALKNYLMDFKKDSQGKSRLVKIDLYMGGSGLRVLTTGKKTPAKITKIDKSSYSWDNGAKSIADKTMKHVPPNVRDNVLDQFIEMSEKVAEERGADTITSDITAEALQRIVKQAKMPPQGMDLMPETSDDFETEKDPVNPDQLSEEYR